MWGGIVGEGRRVLGVCLCLGAHVKGCTSVTVTTAGIMLCLLCVKYCAEHLGIISWYLWSGLVLSTTFGWRVGSGPACSHPALSGVSAWQTGARKGRCKLKSRKLLLYSRIMDKHRWVRGNLDTVVWTWFECVSTQGWRLGSQYGDVRSGKMFKRYGLWKV